MLPALHQWLTQHSIDALRYERNVMSRSTFAPSSLRWENETALRGRTLPIFLWVTGAEGDLTNWGRREVVMRILWLKLLRIERLWVNNISWSKYNMLKSFVTTSSFYKRIIILFLLCNEWIFFFLSLTRITVTQEDSLITIPFLRRENRSLRRIQGGEWL